jgi:hypothetical protein
MEKNPDRFAADDVLYNPLGRDVLMGSVTMAQDCTPPVSCKESEALFLAYVEASGAFIEANKALLSAMEMRGCLTALREARLEAEARRGDLRKARERLFRHQGAWLSRSSYRG